MALEPEEGALLFELDKGADFAGLFEVSAVMSDLEEAAICMAGYLRRWIENGSIGQVIPPNHA
ncbi:hypothetical protein RXV86_01285 [Alisedimentitalea sp. MJ-SS2]|uniref:hypothetical protein n=1 Tax=Aliisedimentitalea sp. MJ-SS2 TaxID=3049795 RepID=UPI0029153BC8|nr:hypothetical protein [Alisedimentitalea sp. MJ-SS2]MDU8926008.1 hypothetical protein [Alisedimentitalea sp. MJ-SS2]